MKNLKLVSTLFLAVSMIAASCTKEDFPEPPTPLDDVYNGNILEGMQWRTVTDSTPKGNQTSTEIATPATPLNKQ